MNSISLENKMSFPLQLTLTGSNLEETKNLPLKDLVLYLEREFKRLEEEFHWLDLQLEIEVDQRRETNESFTIFLTTKDYGGHLIVQDKVEAILWSYNKQVLGQNGGRLYSHYCRFDYIIHYRGGLKLNNQLAS